MKPAYGENISAQDYQRTIYFFEQLMQLLHPFMPFVSEEIYHQLKERAEGDDLCIKQFDKLSHANDQVITEGEFLKQIITAVRDARNKNGIKPKEKIDLHLLNSDSFEYAHFVSILLKQINAGSINSVSEPVPGTINVVIGKHKFFIETENAGSGSSQKEQLLKDLKYLEGFLKSVQKKLQNENFLKGAKPQVIEFERKKESDAEQKIKAIQEILASLN
jgi:valyl-tRNA synthetase